MAEEKNTTFDYLLNVMERAAQEKHPAKAGYAGKRKALLAHVRELERKAAAYDAHFPSGVSGDDAYHCYMFKVEPEPLCMQHQDRKPKRRVGTIGHVGGRTALIAAVAAILTQQAKDDAGVSAAPDHTFRTETPPNPGNGE